MTLELQGPDRQKIVDAQSLTAVLDDLDEHHRRRPSLVALTNSAGTLQIGLGHSSVSVALFLDADRQPWVAQRRSAASSTSGASFSRGDVVYDFYPSAVIPPGHARRAAHEFLETEHRPTSLTWVRDHA